MTFSFLRFLAKIRRSFRELAFFIASVFCEFYYFWQNLQFSQFQANIDRYMQIVTCFRKGVLKRKIIPRLISRSPLSCVQHFILFSILFFVYRFTNLAMDNNTFSHLALQHFMGAFFSFHHFFVFPFPPCFLVV